MARTVRINRVVTSQSPITAFEMMMALVKSGCSAEGALFNQLSEDEKAKVMAEANK